VVVVVVVAAVAAALAEIIFNIFTIVRNKSNNDWIRNSYYECVIFENPTAHHSTKPENLASDTL
jgi:hypothetical protein